MRSNYIDILKDFLYAHARKLLSILGYDLEIKLRSIKKINNINLYVVEYGKDAVHNRRFYNIGSAGFRHPAWTNIDHKSDRYSESQGDSIDIDWDLLTLKPVPIEDNSAEIVYTSHTLEHVTDKAAQNMFIESHRILKKGGVLRVTTPNVDLDYRAYRENDRQYFYWQRDSVNRKRNASIQQLFLHHFASTASTLHPDKSTVKIDNAEVDRVFKEMAYEDALNYCMAKCSLRVQKKYPGGHISWWNKLKLFKFIENAGFNNIYSSGYGQSLSPVLRNTYFFDNTHPKLSVYVEARK